MRNDRSKEPGARPAARAAIACVVSVAIVAALWPLLRTYDWLNRDAQLYALQAIAHVHPERYANDLFFLFGSQDRFTVVTAIVAPIFDALGVERASAWLTVVANIAWWTACYYLARALVGPRLAWISVLAAMVAPGWYGGGGGVFRYAESYFSARLPAEALVLLSIGLQLRGRFLPAVATLAVAATVHPLMTVPGLAMTVLLACPQRRWPTLLLAAAALLASATVLAWFAPVSRLRVVDPEWLSVIYTRSSFLFPTLWTKSDWGGVATTFLLLLAALRVHASNTVCRVALASLIVGVGGLLTSYVGSDLVPIEIVLQGQPWRVLWLATAIATILLPSTIFQAWRSGATGRAAALLLLTTLFALDATADLVATTAATACLLARTAPSNSIGRLLVVASALALATTVVANMLGVIDVLRVPVFGGAGDARLETVRNVAAFALPAFLVAGLAWFLTRPDRSSLAVATAAVLAVALNAFVWRPALSEFATGAYFGDRYRAFESWRGRIPEGTNVLWPTAPVGVWYLLERPSYISISQLAGIVFSRDLALEGARRAERLSSFFDPRWVMGDPAHAEQVLKPLTTQVLQSVCAIPEIGFVVSGTKLPEAVATEAWPDSSHYISLYDCSTLRPTS
jgi:hypothetical protein